MLNQKVTRGIYAGTFDPPTNGHMWLIAESAKLFDELIIAIGVNPEKQTTYSLDDRLKMLTLLTQSFTNVKVLTYTNQYLVEFANQLDVGYIVRGIRSVADYEYEKNMRNINSDIYPNITTLFLFPPREYNEVSSTLVKGLVGFENWEEVIRKYVPEAVREIMIRHYLINN